MCDPGACRRRDQYILILEVNIALLGQAEIQQATEMEGHRLAELRPARHLASDAVEISGPDAVVKIEAARRIAIGHLQPVDCLQRSFPAEKLPLSAARPSVLDGIPTARPILRPLK